MSSLLQHRGNITRKGVGLVMYLVAPDEHGNPTWDGIEHIPCDCKWGKHEQVYEVFRKPVGMLGCWVQFRLNGEVIVPDLSIPIKVTKLPRDARKMDPEEVKEYWHRN